MNTFLYIDCDGVIIDTIDTAFKQMIENHVDMSNNDEIDSFFRQMNWKKLMQESEIINDSINKIKKMKNNNLYEDIIILTKLSGNYQEEQVKRDTFSILLPNTKVITLPRSYNKALVVESRNHILVDDELKNINQWNNNGGIGIQFMKDYANFDKNIINDLDDIENTKSVKRLRKTRFF